MATENIEIKVEDKVDSGVSTKLRGIATDARSAYSAVERLQQALKAIDNSAMGKMQAEMNKSSLANAKLQAAQTQNATAAVRLATAQANLATATTRTATAQTQGATAAQRLATAQQQTATATSNATAAQNRAELSALRLAQAQQKAGQATKTAGQEMLGYVKAAAGLVGLSVTVKSLIDMGDAYTTLQNKLQNVATSQAQVNKLTEELFNLANNTRTGVQETATAFTRFDRSLKQMGKSQEETLRLTETVNKALIVSGATTQEASSALLQLSQGFNAGKLQGDEFRAVAENIPVVLDAVAKALNVPINRVKQLSSEGKITSEVLFKAFGLIQKQIDDTFAKTTPTVGQALTVLKNNAVQFFGELDKATGITKGLANAILILGQNLNILAGIVTVVGTALLVYFGPAIIAAIKTAALAVAAFTASLAANPIGLIVVGIAAAVAALTMFGDKIKATSDGLTNLQDVAASVWSFIKQGFSAVSDFVSAAWTRMISALNLTTSGFAENFSSFFDVIITAVKWTGNIIIGVFVAAFKAIEIVWRRFPDMLQGFFNGAYNLAAMAVEKVVNIWIRGLQGIAGAIGTLMPSVAESMQKALDGLKLEIPKMDIQPGVDAAKELGNAFKSAFTTDYLGDAGGAIMKRARQIANARRAEIDAQSGGGGLRGSGENQLGKDVDSKAAKAAERRALALQKINTQLDNELSRMFTLQPMREAQAKMDQIEESLIQKKIKLTKDERAAIMEKITAVQQATIVQQKYDEVYNDAVGPLRDYTATLQASQKLLLQGSITEEQYARSVVKASEAYMNAADPLRQYNKELDQQLKLLGMLPKQREIEQQIMQVQNDLLNKGIILGEKELQQLRERLQLIQQTNAVSQQEAALMDASVQKRQTFIDQLTAINNLMKNKDSGFTKSDALTAIGGTEVGQFLGSSPEMMEAQIAQYQNYYAQIDALRQADLISEQTAANARMQIWNAQQNVQLDSAKGFFGNLASLQSSSNKRIASIGKAAAIAQAMINTYQSATAAYAAMAAIPIVGPALGAAAAAAAVVAGLANVQQIRSQSTSGYMTGGYTGNGPIGQVAGMVHGKEFVMNAGATQRIGVENLQRLQNGGSLQDGSNSGGGEVNVNVINEVGGGIQFDVRQITERDVEVIVRRTMAKETDGMVAGAVANPNSKTSRSMARNTKIDRRRD